MIGYGLAALFCGLYLWSNRKLRESRYMAEYRGELIDDAHGQIRELLRENLTMRLERPSTNRIVTFYHPN